MAAALGVDPDEHFKSRPPDPLILNAPTGPSIQQRRRAKSMSFQWPEFTVPNAIGGSRAWTARFDSYDQRNDDCYYLISVLDNGVETTRFMARIDLSWSQDSGPEFVSRLRDEVRDAALRGRTNTDYRGRGA
jgi:hypothetical protein